MHIGILQCGQSPEEIRETVGDYADMFVRLLEDQGFRFTIWHVEAMAFPSSVEDADGWLLTGSRHGAYEDHEFIPPLENFIRDAKTAGKPMVGVCFGHQIMAQALGGKVEKFSGGWSVGAKRYVFEDGANMVLNAWHQDQVVQKPEGAEVIASNDFCANAGLSYGNWGLSIQPHPEFSDEVVLGLMEHRGRGIVPDDLLAGARDSLTEPKDSARFADRIAKFFRAAEVQQ